MKSVKKSTLATIGLTAMAILVTSCASNPPANQQTVSAEPSQNPIQTLDTALEAASSPSEKADICAKAMADATAELGKAKAEAEAKQAAADKAPEAMGVKKKAQGEANKAKAKETAADEWLTKKLPAKCAVSAGEDAVEAVSDFVAPE